MKTLLVKSLGSLRKRVERIVVEKGEVERLDLRLRKIYNCYFF